MPRRRSRGRVASPNASAAAPTDIFDDAWLAQYRERQSSRLVDLTNFEDRRRWHPNNMPPAGPSPRSMIGRPRIVIVPEGHRLARLAPYGGRVPLEHILAQRELDRRIRRRSFHEPREHRLKDKYGVPYRAYIPDHFSTRIGFQYPWQVMICVRRKRRKEVLHALKKTGGRGAPHKKPRRNYWSEVRC